MDLGFRVLGCLHIGNASPPAVTPAAEPHAAPNFRVWRDLVSEQNFFVSVTFSIPHRNIHTSALSVAIVAEV